MSARLGLVRMVEKELVQLRRDRKMIPVLVLGPLFQLLALGFAANNDVTDVPLLLVDEDRSRASRELVERFTGSGWFKLVGAADSVREVDRALVGGEAQLVLVIAAGFGEALASGRTGRVQILADGSDSASAVVGLGYASRIVAAFGAEAVRDRLPVGIAAAGAVKLRSRTWYNPDLRSRWFYVPAVVAMVLMLATMILPSMAVVREKEIGTLEQLIVTPVRPWQVIAGKLVPFALIGLVDTVLVTALAVGVFGVPLRGSPWLLLGLTALFLLNTLGFGLLVSSLVRTQQQAMLASMYLLMVPFIYLSGLIFPIENMPVVLQWGTWLVPVRYYAVILRGVFLKGATLATLWPEALALLGSGLGVLALASLRFRKSLD